MEIKTGKIRCKFSFGFFALLAVYMLLDTKGFGVFMLCGVIIHELGHWAVLYSCGGCLERIEFAPYGIRMEKRGFLSYREEAAVYAAGVLANGIAVVICFALKKTEGFAAVNLLLAVFNLLPIGRLDGGVLLKLAVCKAGYDQYADTVAAAFAFVLLIPLFCAAFWLASKGNASLLFTAFYLLGAQIFSKDSFYDCFKF